MSQEYIFLLGMLGMFVLPIGGLTMGRRIRSTALLVCTLIVSVAGVGGVGWFVYREFAGFPMPSLPLLFAVVLPTMFTFGLSQGIDTAKSDEKRKADQLRMLEAFLTQWQEQLKKDVAGSANPLAIAYDQQKVGFYCKGLGQTNEALGSYDLAYATYKVQMGSHPSVRTFYEGYAELLRQVGRQADAEEVERTLRDK